MITHEYDFVVDDFGNPIEYKNGKAIAKLLARLLVLEPGTFQSHPDMGVGLISKYRYTMDAQALQADFRSQIAKYLPQFQAVEVYCKLENSVCYIGAKIDGYLYAFFYDTESNEIKTTFKSLGDL